MAVDAQSKARLDLALVERGLCRSRTQARTCIQRGGVQINGLCVDKPSILVHEQDLVELHQGPPYVSRGGEKLEDALRFFQIDMQDKFCLDAGASTGGFTDCMLAHGARRVVAIDVGQNQLAPRLREDSRVEWHEKTDARALPDAIRAMRFDFIAVDLSFISLSQALPHLFDLAADGGLLLALVKPQFEAGRGRVDKGVVRDIAVRAACVEKIACQITQAPGWEILGTKEASPHGTDGNVEYFIHACYCGNPTTTFLASRFSPDK